MITIGLVILAGIAFTLMNRTEKTGRGSTFGLCIAGGVIASALAIGYAGGIIT